MSSVNRLLHKAGRRILTLQGRRGCLRQLDCLLYVTFTFDL